MRTNKRTLIGCAAIAVLGTALPAGAQVQAGKAGAAPAQTGVVTTSSDYSKSMERLMQAAQRLRETIQALATKPAGDERNAAMEAARDALLDTQQAMIDLPPELRNRSGSMSEADYGKSMEKLKQAAQRLRDSAQAMATQPAGGRRNEAIDKVNEALLEVNQAMVQLPWQPAATKTGATGGRTAAGATGSGTSDFDRLDRDGDGMINRSEFSQQAAGKPHGTGAR